MIANDPIRTQITAITTNVLGLVPSVLTVIVVIICAVTVEVAVTVSVYVPIVVRHHLVDLCARRATTRQFRLRLTFNRYTPALIPSVGSTTPSWPPAEPLNY